MPLNPLIPLQTHPVQVGGGESLIDRQLKLMQLDAAQSQSGLRALQMQELQRQLRDQQIAQEYLRGGGAFVGGNPGMPRPDALQQGAPVPPVAGPITESGGYMSRDITDNASGQVPVPAGSTAPIIQEGGIPPGAQQMAMQQPQTPQRRQLKPLSELAVDFYSKFPSIASGMVKQFDEAIKTETTANKTYAETIEAQSKAQKTIIEAKKQHLELMTSVLNGMQGNPERFQEGMAALRELNVPEGLLGMIGPTYNEANIQKLRLMGADQKTLLEQQAKQADRMLEYQKLGLEQQKFGLEQQREARLGSEVILADTGAEQIPIQRYGGGTVPGGAGGAGPLGSAKEHAVMAPVRAEMMKNAQKIGETAKGTLDTIDQLEGLYREGIYPNNRPTKIALGYLDETGSAPPRYDKDTLVRTREFINRAERMSLVQLNEQTLTPVTDTDLAIVRRASGNFGSISSKEQMELAFKETRELAQRRAKQADEALEQAKTGRLGGYEQTIQQRNQQRPPLSQPKAAPGRPQSGVTINATEYQRGFAAAQKMGYSKEQYDAHLRANGIQVPQ